MSDDDIDITQLELHLFPTRKRPSEMTAEDFAVMSAKLEALTDQYGADRISAVLRELTSMTGG